MAYFAGKNILISGGSSGIGEQVVRKLLQNGAANVAVLDICVKNDAIANMQREFPDHEVIYLETDVADKANVQRSFEEAKAKFGYLDIVIGNAGVANEECAERTIQINLIGIINTTYTAIEYMSIAKGGRGGTILNVASIAGLNALHGFPSYTASKHGIVGFTHSFENNYYSTTYGIKFITVCPGFTVTPMLENGNRFDCDNEGLQQIMSIQPFQSADQAADAFLQILQNGNHGSIWIAEGGDVRQISVPKYFKTI